jgi:hypothetical protein
MAEAVRRERGSARLPAKADAAAELAVPHPAMISRDSRDRRSVGKRDRGSGRLTVHQASDELSGVGGDLFQVLAGRGFAAHVVWRPASPESGDVAEKVLLGRPDELHIVTTA